MYLLIINNIEINMVKCNKVIGSKAINNSLNISHNVEWHSPSKDIFKRSIEVYKL